MSKKIDSIASIGQVKFLPFYWLSSSWFVNDLVQETKLVGTGFASSKNISIIKSKSELLERELYYKWNDTGISPFDNYSKPCPPATIGMGCNFDHELAVKHAFLEWYERSILLEIYNGNISFKISEQQPFGLFFKYASLFLVDKFIYLYTETKPTVAMTLAFLKPHGVLMGSGCCQNKNDAILKATMECCYKFANLALWKENSELPFRKRMSFWVSKEGSETANNFVNKTICNHNNSELVEYKFKSDKMQCLKHLDSYISIYYDENFQLPDLHRDIYLPLC